MPSHIVRVSPWAHKTIKQISKQTHRPIQAIIDDVIERERRKCFLDAADESYRKLKVDPIAWREYQDELAVWDVTLLDGLDKSSVIRKKRN